MYRRTPGIAALLAILALPASAFAAISGGTGYFVTADGYFLTCFQVIDGAQSISLKTGDGSIFDAEIVAVNRSNMSGLEPVVEGAIAVVSVDPDRLIEEEQAGERDQAERLRRARREQEARRTEAARKLEAEHIRQREINRLRTTVMNLEQRESSLHHELMSVHQQLNSVSRDPADHSAMARRSALERELDYLRNQLNQITTSKQGAMNQLNQQYVR